MTKYFVKKCKIKSDS